MRIDVKVEGAEELLRRFRDPALIAEPLGGLLKAVSGKAHGVAKNKIRGGTEQAMISIAADVKPLEAVVYSRIAHARAMSIEEGRKPGEVIPYMQAVRWATGSPYATQRRMSEYLRSTGKYYLSTEEHRAARRLQEYVRVHGAKGKKFIESAANAAREILPRLVDKMAQAVEERWRQSRGI